MRSIGGRKTAPLSGRSLTYDEVGIVLEPALRVPTGFRGYERSVRVGSGPECWQHSADALTRWEVKTRSGFAVERGDDSQAGLVQSGVDYWLVARIGPWRVREPVRVVAVIGEPDRIGYAYGTLDGQPIVGEESFEVARRLDDSVWFTLRSLTRPASGGWRLVFPGVLVAQRYYRRRLPAGAAASSLTRVTLRQSGAAVGVVA